MGAEADRVRSIQVDTLRNAADYFEADMSTAWGGDAAWLTSGTKVADLVACVLREIADELAARMSTPPEATSAP